MQDLSRFQLASNLKWLLLSGMAAVLVLLLYSSWRATVTNLDKLRGWSRHPAYVTGSAGENSVEVEVTQAVADAIYGVQTPDDGSPFEPPNVRMQVPGTASGPLGPLFDVVLLQNPSNPAELALLNPWSMWLPVAMRLLAALLLVLIARWLLGAPWGEDVTWSQGAWMPTEQFGTPAGARGDVAAIVEPRAKRLAPMIWTGLLAALLLLAVVTLPSGAARPAYAPLVLLVLVGLVAIAGYTLLETGSRRLLQDDNGICDTTFFGARRVPWEAIAAVVRRNINEDSQASYDRARKRSGKRPQDIFVQELRDAEGTVILQFSDDLEPAAGYARLLTRAAGRDALERWRAESAVSGRPVSGPAHLVEAEQDADVDADDADLDPGGMPEELARAQQDFEDRHRQTTLTMRRGWMLMVLPFALITLWLGWRAIWFQYLAERIDGVVVEVGGGELRSLVVEYRDADGAVHRIDSDGTRAYARYDVTDRIRVFYDRAQPDSARLDLFLELWLGTMIMGGLTALIALPLLFIRP